jgi:hypothetical protein
MTVAMFGDIVSSSQSFKTFKNSFLYNKLLVGFLDHLLYFSAICFFSMFFPIIFIAPSSQLS